MTGRRVLVVDDEEGVLVTTAAILRLDGHAVQTARDVEGALAILRSHQPDAVLTDLRLGEEDGLRILGHVRRERADCAVILLTGYASIGSALAALREGAYDYLIKPSDPDELRATVSRALERTLLMRRVAELQELDELKSQFLSIATHELRTPLTVISGFTQLAQRTLREGRLDDPAERERLSGQLSMIKERSDRLARLVEELLDVTRMQSGRLQFVMAPTDLSALARAVVEQQRIVVADRRYEIEADGEVQVVGDRDRLEQVIANLVDNAAKYSREGGRVAVRVWRGDAEAGVTVEDDGIGIPPEHLSRVFELFVRVPEAGTWRPGLGVGLYVARGIIERHGGRIWAESEPGRGTRMHVALPARVRGAAAAPERVTARR